MQAADEGGKLPGAKAAISEYRKFSQGKAKLLRRVYNRTHS